MRRPLALVSLLLTATAFGCHGSPMAERIVTPRCYFESGRQSVEKHTPDRSGLDSALRAVVRVRGERPRENTTGVFVHPHGFILTGASPGRDVESDLVALSREGESMELSPVYWAFERFAHTTAWRVFRITPELGRVYPHVRHRDPNPGEEVYLLTFPDRFGIYSDRVSCDRAGELNALDPLISVGVIDEDAVVLKAGAVSGRNLIGAPILSRDGALLGICGGITHREGEWSLTRVGVNELSSVLEETP